MNEKYTINRMMTNGMSLCLVSIFTLRRMQDLGLTPETRLLLQTHKGLGIRLAQLTIGDSFIRDSFIRDSFIGDSFIGDSFIGDL